MTTEVRDHRSSDGSTVESLESHVGGPFLTLFLACYGRPGHLSVGLSFRRPPRLCSHSSPLHRGPQWLPFGSNDGFPFDLFDERPPMTYGGPLALRSKRKRDELWRSVTVSPERPSPHPFTYVPVGGLVGGWRRLESPTRSLSRPECHPTSNSG